ncbi:MAG: phosphatidylglycerophosphatase A [Bacteriovoracaceae bacterium]|nr:phosphatidylglycerophosphatase A [Bacteriovoracaceae bacterium]
MDNSRNRPKIKIVDKVLLSFFGAGLTPFAPGTFGTIAAIPVGYLLIQLCSPVEIIIITIILSTIFSFMLEAARKRYGLKDPGWIVIDEVLGYFTAIALVPNPTLPNLLIAAALFRFFDIFKIWPASFFDKKVEHGSGIILDDIVAGLYAGGVCLLLHYFQITA